jgi:hypothetical protein
LNRGQENLAPKKNSSSEDRKIWRIFGTVGKLLMRKPSKIVDPCSHSPSTEVEQNGKNDIVACRKEKLRSTETTKIGGGGLTGERPNLGMKTTTRQKIPTRSTNYGKKNMRLRQGLRLTDEEEHTSNKTSRSNA